MWNAGSIARFVMRLLGRHALRRGARTIASPDARERLRAWIEDPGHEGVSMFERFTDEARRAVVRAEREAHRLNHNYVGTEHLLLGLLADDTVASASLRLFDVDAGRVDAQVREVIGVGPEPPTGRPPFTPRTKKVMELALREALQLGGHEVGAEHLLLGLLREGEGVGAQAIVRLDVDPGSVRQEVLRRTTAAPGVRPRPAIDPEPHDPDAPISREERLGLRPDLAVALEGIVRRLEGIESRLAALEHRIDEGRREED